MDGPQNDVSPATAAPPRTLLCPECGYDLRGATGDRCSECGLVIDREALRRSGFPWAHRKSIGRVQAFSKTVWLVTADGRALRQETAKEQSVHDAAKFRRWVALSLSICFIGAATMLIQQHVIADLAVKPPSATVVAWKLSGWEQDLLVPWSAGIVFPPALVAYAVLLAFYVAGAPASVLRTGGMSEDYAQAVRTIGCYVAAPLFLVLPAGVLFVGTVWMARTNEVIERTTLLVPLVIIATYVIVFVAIAGTVYRTGQWRSRTTDRAWSTGFLAMGELLLRWAVGCVAVLGVVPWCVGFVWIVSDSLR
jgi:hypothetical protein